MIFQTFHFMMQTLFLTFRGALKKNLKFWWIFRALSAEFKLKYLLMKKTSFDEIKTENESFNKTKEDLTTMSMQHINDELTKIY